MVKAAVVAAERVVEAVVVVGKVVVAAAVLAKVAGEAAVKALVRLVVGRAQLAILPAVAEEMRLRPRRNSI